MARILVVDDDQDMRKLLRKTLEKAGYEVVEAPDGVKATRVYQQNPADIIITDIFMPEKEGLELIQEVKRNFPGAKIIAISGGVSEHLSSISSLDYLQMAKRMEKGSRIVTVLVDRRDRYFAEYPNEHYIV